MRATAPIPHSGNAVPAAESERDDRLMPSPYGTRALWAPRDAKPEDPAMTLVRVLLLAPLDTKDDADKANK